MQKRRPSAYPPGFEIPDGWLDCPAFGHNLRPPKEKVGLIPCKVQIPSSMRCFCMILLRSRSGHLLCRHLQVPLGERFSPYIPEDRQMTPAKLIAQLGKKGYQVRLHYGSRMTVAGIRILGTCTEFCCCFRLGWSST